ncbi:MAG: GerMN domain-containing protein [Tissierellia bacterium]|nr:GerMN domain-containing protein [Tissierellia bacterium]
MYNRRAISVILILVLALAIINLKEKEVFKKFLSKDKGEEFEIIRSEEYDFEITEDDDMRKTILYFRDKQGLLVPIMRRIPWEEGIARVTLENMVDSAELRESLAPTGLSPIIPAGTQVLGMAIDDETGICRVNFSDEILEQEDKEDEEGLIKGIVYTLTEFQGIKSVQMLIGGEIVPSLAYGTDISTPISRDNINLAGDLDRGRSKVVAYYKGLNSEKDFEYFVPVTIPTLAPVPNIHTAIEMLFDGPPMGLVLGSDIPEGASFHGVDVKDGIAYVDVSFENTDLVKDGIVLNRMLRNIGLTLSEFDEIAEVEMLIDGKSMEEIGIDIEMNRAIPAFANEQ